MDIKKRTERMLAEARKKLLIHESLSREETKKHIPLSSKLKVALPLAGIVIALYMWSFAYTKNRHGKRHEPSQPNKILTDVRQVYNPELTEEEPRYQSVCSGPPDPEELSVDHIDKKW